MKILHIIPNLRKGGAERMVIDIVRELANREGIFVCLVLFRDEIAYEIDDIRHLIHFIPSSARLSLWRKNKFSIDKLQKFISDFQPDIIHSHLFEAELVSRSCSYSKAKWFSHGHDTMQQLKKFKIQSIFSKQKLTELYEKTFLIKRYKLNGGTSFIAISKLTENYFKQNIPTQGLMHLNNAIDYKKFKNNEIRANCQIPIKLINVGSFVTKKNQRLLIYIAKELKNKFIEFEVHFLGDGKLLHDIFNLAENLELIQNCYFHGNVDNVQNHLSESDIYIHTASHEPLGLVILEAMAAGLPVITLNGGGNRDLIEEGKNGFLIEEENVEHFTEKILELVKNPALYKEMSQYAQSFAQKFDIVPYVDNLLKLYKKES
jgi:glycosyltransferase involved in cell wall biosynthesis